MALAPAQFAIVILSGRDHDGQQQRPGGCARMRRREQNLRAPTCRWRRAKFERTVLARNYAAVA